MTPSLLSATLPEVDGWDSISQEGAERVLAIANAPAGDFRPNLVLTSTPSAAPIEAASSVSIAAIFTDHPGAQVIAVELWTGQGVHGREITASYPLGDLQVVIRRWVWATGQRHVHLTASAATHQFLAMEPTFTFVASTLALSGEISGTVVDADASPTLDVVATEAAGEPLELLDRVPSFQPYTPPALRLSEAAQGALLAARTTGALAWRSPAQRELRDSGLLEGNSRRLSPFALQVVAHWDAGVIQLEANTTRGGVTRLLCSWTRGESTLFAFGTSTPQNEADAGTLAIELRPVGQTIDLFMRFLGVGPMWTRATEPEQLPVTSLDERLAANAQVAPAPPPAGSNAAFTRFWNQEWTELRVRSPHRSFRVIATPSAGLLTIGAPQTAQPGDAESTVPVAALPSYALYTQLLELFEAEIRG